MILPAINLARKLESQATCRAFSSHDMGRRILRSTIEILRCWRNGSMRVCRRDRRLCVKQCLEAEKRIFVSFALGLECMAAVYSSGQDV